MLLLLGLLVQQTVVLTMLPLGLLLAIVLPLAAQRLALMVVVVLSDLLLQTVVMRRQLAAIAQR